MSQEKVTLGSRVVLPVAVAVVGEGCATSRCYRHGGAK